MSPAGNGATIIIVPDAPTNLANVPTVTSATQVGLTWQTGLSTGGTAIVSYVLSYDQGINTYVVLNSTITSTGYVATGLVAGTTYNFKVQANNGYGLSAYSNIATVLAA